MKLGELKKLAQAAEGLNPASHQEFLRLLGLEPGNLYQELEMTSRLVETHRDIGGTNAGMQLHSHNFFELIYCCNTCGAEYLVGSERYRIRKGDVIFVPPGVSHRPMLPETLEEPYSRYVLWLSPEFMVWYATLYPYSFTERNASTSLLRTGGTRWEVLGELFRQGVQESEQQADGWEAAVVGNTVTLLTVLKRATEDRSARAMKAEKPELLDKIMVYLEKNYEKSITIGDVAKAFFVSESTVSHLFKQKMGVSFYRYVTQRRLIAAKLLIEKGVLLEDAARGAGFQEYSGFYRAFRQAYGISPRQYRYMQEPGAR